jgi:hypothetical protein
MTDFPETSQLLRDARDQRRAHALAEAQSGIHLVPSHLREGIVRYAIDGGHVGHFLTAVVSNDLHEAVSRGDDPSLAGLKGLMQFLYNYAPAPCWGSPAKVAAWQACGGVRGYKES